MNPIGYDWLRLATIGYDWVYFNWKRVLNIPSQDSECNAKDARLARFFRLNHTPGKITVPEVKLNPDFPFTLDLRHT